MEGIGRYREDRRVVCPGIRVRGGEGDRKEMGVEEGNYSPSKGLCNSERSSVGGGEVSERGRPEDGTQRRPCGFKDGGRLGEEDRSSLKGEKGSMELRKGRVSV